MYIEDERRAGSLEDLTDRLMKSGGKVIGIIVCGEQQGAIAENGTNYFIMYPNGEFDRIDNGYPEQRHLRSGWLVKSLRPDPAKTEGAIVSATDEIQLTVAEVTDLTFLVVSYLNGRVVDAYPDSLYKDNPRYLETVDGKTVAVAEYAVIARNENEEDNEDEGDQCYDFTLRFKFWRDSHTPTLVHSKQI